MSQNLVNWVKKERSNETIHVETPRIPVCENQPWIYDDIINLDMDNSSHDDFHEDCMDISHAPQYGYLNEVSGIFTEPGEALPTCSQCYALSLDKATEKETHEKEVQLLKLNNEKLTMENEKLQQKIKSLEKPKQQKTAKIQKRTSGRQTHMPGRFKDYETGLK